MPHKSWGLNLKIIQLCEIYRGASQRLDSPGGFNRHAASRIYDASPETNSLSIITQFEVFN